MPRRIDHNYPIREADKVFDETPTEDRLSGRYPGPVPTLATTTLGIYELLQSWILGTRQYLSTHDTDEVERQRAVDLMSAEFDDVGGNE